MPQRREPESGRPHDRTPRSPRARQRHRRRDRPHGRGLPGRAGRAEGRDAADRRGAGRVAVRRPWGRPRSSRAARAPTRRSGAALLGAKTGFVGKVRDDELGGLFAPRPQGDRRRASPSPAADRRAGHRPLLRPGDAGRRAHDEHLSGRLPGPVARPTSTRRSWRRPASSTSRATSGIRRPPRTRSARPSTIAHQAGNAVALTLSDAFCVGRYRDEFLGLIRDGSIDILFANIGELQSLYETDDPEAAVAGPARRAQRPRQAPARPRHPLGRGRPGGAGRRGPGRRGLPGARASWTRPAPATCSRPASWPATPAASTTSPAPASARSRPPR